MSHAASDAAVRRVAIIIGSHHSGSQSDKVGRFIARRIEALGPGATTFVLQLAEAGLPLWTGDVCEEDDDVARAWREISDELVRCSGVIVVTPEWGGMVPAALKNFFLYCDDHQLAHKPGLLVAVSSGSNGAYPIAELRMSGTKNTHLCLIPDHVIVRDVDEVLNADAAPSAERQLRDRIDYSLRMLLTYTDALCTVRSSGVVDLESYPYGM